MYSSSLWSFRVASRSSSIQCVVVQAFHPGTPAQPEALWDPETGTVGWRRSGCSIIPPLPGVPGPSCLPPSQTPQMLARTPPYGAVPSVKAQSPASPSSVTISRSLAFLSSSICLGAPACHGTQPVGVWTPLGTVGWRLRWRGPCIDVLAGCVPGAR